MQSKIVFNSLLVKRLGYLASFLAWGFLIEYFIRMFWLGSRTVSGQFLSAGTLGFVGLLAIVIAECLKKIEDKLFFDQKE